MKRGLIVFCLCAGFASSWLIWVNARYQDQMELSKKRLAMHATKEAQVEIDRRFNEAIVMLHAKQYENAITSLHRVLEIDPKMPEAYVNMGFALLGLRNYKAAHDFFQGAIELRAMQANAYYGLGEALINMKDDAGALGALRTYVHLANQDDPYIAKANAIIGKLNEKLGRNN